MNRKSIYLPFVVLVAVLSASSSKPQKDIPGLTSAIDASVAGHYGQSILHEDEANKSRAAANKVLAHWTDDHYWNIDEYQKAMDAASVSASHRQEAEKEMCQWLAESHSHNHPQDTTFYQAVAYFHSGQDVPFKVNHEDIAVIGHWLQFYPNATADVRASADTVGSSSSNKALSDRRAAAISKLLITHGAKAEQLRVNSVGEGPGPDNTPSQPNRAASVGSVQFNYTDCPNVEMTALDKPE